MDFNSYVMSLFSHMSEGPSPVRVSWNNCNIHSLSSLSGTHMQSNTTALLYRFYVYEVYTFSVFVDIVKKVIFCFMFIIEVLVGDSGVLGCITLNVVPNILSIPLTYMRGYKYKEHHSI